MSTPYDQFDEHGGYLPTLPDMGLVHPRRWFVCPNCGAGHHTSWARFCHAHVYRVRLVPLASLPPERVVHLRDELRAAYEEEKRVH